nr:hypothetical protein [FCB group bacterium]
MKKLQSPETQSLLIILLVLTSLCALSCETSVEDPDPPDFELEILNRYGVIRIPENTNVRFYNNTDTPKTVYLEIRNPYGFFVGNTAAETVIAHPFSSVMLSYSLSDESLV